MSKLLSKVKSGKVRAPLRVLVYGVEGVGKTTFAADAESPLFVCAERGTNELDVRRFHPGSWREVRDLARELEQEKHEHKTLVFDTADWLDALLGKEIARWKKKTTVGEIAYGRGYDLVADEWRAFLAQLDQLQARRGMTIVLLGHAAIVKAKNPEGEDYQRWAVAVHEKTAAVLRQWSDVVLFAGFELSVRREGDRGPAKATGGQTRWIYTQRTAAYDAKNRFELPGRIALSWSELMSRIEQARSDPSALRRQVLADLEQLPEALRAQAREQIEKAGADQRKLSQAQNWIHARLDELQAAPAGEETEAPFGSDGEGEPEETESKEDSAAIEAGRKILATTRDLLEGKDRQRVEVALREAATLEQIEKAIPWAAGLLEAQKKLRAELAHPAADPAPQGPPRATPAEVGP